VTTGHDEWVTESPVRDAVDSDLEACIALWVEASAARDGAAVPGIAERARAKFEHTLAWLVAGEAARVDGFALTTTPGSGIETDPPGAAVLGMLGVSPRAQGAGLGRRLLAAAEARLSALGFEQAVLHVLVDNTAAVALYESAGWRPLGERYDHTLLHRPVQSYLRELGGTRTAEGHTGTAW
jgi:ribosomal protein S18 acetylase RimI-like enzyme